MGHETLKFRGAIREDGPFILWLEKVCMKDYAIALWGSWRPSTTLDVFNINGHEIIEYNEQTVGCIAISRSEDCLRIDKLYISPDFQRQGIGAKVIAVIAARAANLNLSIKLNVLRTNPALEFYLREGFIIESETAERRMLVKQ